MPRHVSPRTSLGQLKREAKRWLHDLRTGIPAARERFVRALGHPPDRVTLREVQHALAREFGLGGWHDLRALLAQRVAPSEQVPTALVDRFLELACPDHHIRGTDPHARAQHAALRMLDAHPELATANFTTAVVCGEVEAVQLALRDNPALAALSDPRVRTERAEPGTSGDLFHELGPKGWPPLLYLAFTRLPLPEVTDHSVEIATLLLDHGADPNAHFMAGNSRYTPLVGVIGEGEEGRPAHQCRDQLVALLMERGAEPYDVQVLYNIHFGGELRWYLERMRAHSLRRGRAADWADPDWKMFGMGGFGPGAYFCLRIAIEHGKVDDVRWLLEQGANPDLPRSAPPGLASAASPYELAVRRGHDEIAQLLREHGATADPLELSPAEQLLHAALRADHSSAAILLREHPALRDSAEVLVAAVERDRADAVTFLLDLGVSPNVATPQGEFPLHAAAYRGSVAAARVLIARGAQIDAVGALHHNTALGGAIYMQQQGMVDLLSGLSRDIWELVASGRTERVRELLAQEPALATQGGEHESLLMWLPADEDAAVEMMRLLLRHGADPAVVNREGMTAADRAARQGMTRVAAELRAAAAARADRPTMARFDAMAENLLEVYRTGTPEAMQRHWNDTWHRRSWEAMKRYVKGDLGFPEHEEHELTRDEARWLVAHGHQFETWQELEAYVRSLDARPALPAGAPVEVRPPAGGRRARTASRDWYTIFDRLRAGDEMELMANGQMTDDILAIVAGIPSVVSLRLDACKRLTDAGIRHLAGMPQLRHLDLGSTGVTDAGVGALAELTQLESLSLGSTAVTDAGIAALASCAALRRVDLMWTRTGDGALGALAGLAQLGHFTSGMQVTDAGLLRLHEWPAFKQWSGQAVDSSLFAEVERGHLWLRGALSDRGMAALVGLDGLVSLNIEDARMPITAAGVRTLAALPHLEALAFDATDATMPAIAGLPRLRRLSCQDTAAGDDGFVALSASRTLEHIWGRESANLGDRGFAALSTMPALHTLSVSCRHVSDAAVALLPDFPALRDLMPMGVPDEGYRHIGRCEALERLTLMYCRETGDRATELIAPLRKLRHYFASYTRITDRTPELLAEMESLEKVELVACAGVTDAGAAALARLPRLREVTFGGCRQVTAAVVSAFAAEVEVERTA